jgi:hypothetical protein
MHVFSKRRVTRAAVAAALACVVQSGARAAPDAPMFPVPASQSPDAAAVPPPPLLLAQSRTGGWGLGVLAPALPMPVKPNRSVEVTAELPPCEPVEAGQDSIPGDTRQNAAPGDAGRNPTPGDAGQDVKAGDAGPSAANGDGGQKTPPGDASGKNSSSAGSGQPVPAADAGQGGALAYPGQNPSSASAEQQGVQQECAVIPTAGPVATSNAIDVALDYVPPASGAGAPVKWGRPIGTPPKPWFSGVATQEGLMLGNRSLTYRSLEGPSVSVGSLTPFSPAWSTATPIGGVQVSNLTAPSDATVPEGKLGYSSVWGHLNNTDPAATSGGVDYGAPVGTSSLRYGLLPQMTVEGQVQSARGLTATGLGTTYSMGEWGTLQGGATQSHFDTAEGWRYRLGYNVDVFDSLTLGYSNELTSTGYGDLSTYEDGAIGSRQLRNTFSAGVPIAGFGQLSGTYSGLRDTSGELIERRFGVSQSMMLSPNVRLAVGADRDVVSGDYAVNMQLTLPIGGR